MDFFTHLREIRSAEDRLRLLRAARLAYLRAMRVYLSQVDAEIESAEAALTQAHTDRVEGNESCPPNLPVHRLRQQRN